MICDWRGVFPAVTTSFYADESVDVPATQHSSFHVATTLRGRLQRVVLDPDVRLLATFSER